MKRKFLKPLVCILLAVSMLLAPLSAMAASSKAYIMRVNVSAGTDELAAILGFLLS